MFNALIRTHHITSRKKVASLKAAAKELQCYVLLRSRGVPGVMFVQGNNREQVQGWIDTVRNLRYKDYQLSSSVSSSNDGFPGSTYGSLEEVSTVKEMAARMDANGLTAWWRKRMGFTNI